MRTRDGARKKKHYELLSIDNTNPDVPRTWRKQTGGQLKTWATTLKEDLVRLIGPAVVGSRRGNKE